MAKRKVKKSKTSAKNSNNNNLFAFLASFFTIIGFIVALILWKDNKYVMFYAKQGLVLFIAQLIISLLSPLVFLEWILWVSWIILWVITWVNALSGKEKKTFLIGDLSAKFNF